VLLCCWSNTQRAHRRSIDTASYLPLQAPISSLIMFSPFDNPPCGIGGPRMTLSDLDPWTKYQKNLCSLSGWLCPKPILRTSPLQTHFGGCYWSERPDLQQRSVAVPIYMCFAMLLLPLLASTSLHRPRLMDDVVASLFPRAYFSPFCAASERAGVITSSHLRWCTFLQWVDPAILNHTAKLYPALLQ
jgi:hypothetical protein